MTRTPAGTTVTATGRPTERARQGGHTGIALAVIVGCQFMLVVDGTIVNVALPSIQRSLHMAPIELSWTLNAYTLTFGGLLLLGGRMGDVLGRRRMFTAGMSIFTVASLVGGVAPTASTLLAARAVQGVGAALAGPSTLSLIATNFADGPSRHRALGAFSAVAGGGGSLGIIAGGMLTDWASWRWVMLVNVPIGVAIVALAPLYVHESERHSGRFDLPGALTSGLGTAGLVYGFIHAASDGWHDPLTIGAFGVAAVLLAAFLTFEVRATQPIMPLRLFWNRNRASAYLNMLLLGAAMTGVFFFLSQFMQDQLRFSPLRAGVAFLSMTVPLFAAARTAPVLLRRWGPKAVTVAGTVLIVAAMAWLTRLSSASDFVSGLLGPLLLVGIGVGLTFMPLNTVILTGVPRQDSGAASGLLQALQRVGGSLGLAILVTVFASGTRRADRAHAFAHGIATAYIAGTILTVAALVVALIGIVSAPRRGRERPVNRPSAT